MTDSEKIPVIRRKWPPPPGETVILNGKMYMTCEDCGRPVQVNKFIIGSMHFCVNPEERR